MNAKENVNWHRRCTKDILNMSYDKSVIFVN